MTRWYVAHTQPLAETLAADNLRAQGFAVYLPRYRKTRRHARRIDSVIRPLFPRYLFVGLDDTQNWRPIRSTRGVQDLVRQGDAPVPAPEAVLAEIRAREDEAGLVRIIDASRLTPGDRVEIVAGPFCEQTGLLDRMTDDQRVIVLLSLLGRAVRVTAPIDAIRRYG